MHTTCTPKSTRKCQRKYDHFDLAQLRWCLYDENRFSALIPFWRFPIQFDFAVIVLAYTSTKIQPRRVEVNKMVNLTYDTSRSTITSCYSNCFLRDDFELTRCHLKLRLYFWIRSIKMQCLRGGVCQEADRPEDLARARRKKAGLCHGCCPFRRLLFPLYLRF